MRCPAKFWPTQCWPLLRPGLPALQAGRLNRLLNMTGLPGAFWKAAFSIGPKIGHMTPRSGWAWTKSLLRFGFNHKTCLLTQVMTLNRLIEPSSELAMSEWVARSALSDILKEDFSQLNGGITESCG